MKRVKLLMLVKDKFSRASVEQLPDVGEIERYEEGHIKGEKNVVEEHSVDSLVEGAFDFAQGLWLALKGFGKMSMFAIIAIATGIKWLWSQGAGKKSEGKKVKRGAT